MLLTCYFIFSKPFTNTYLEPFYSSNSLEYTFYEVTFIFVPTFLIGRKFKQEIFGLSEKIKNFEFLMEEITKLKEANKKENKDLIRSLILTENEKKRAFDLAK